jgi:hypothetical protein
MATDNFSVPEDVKLAFNATFASQNTSPVIAELMRAAVARNERQRRGAAAVERIVERHRLAPRRGAKASQAARVKGRP